jgi:hypothetical protein
MACFNLFRASDKEQTAAVTDMSASLNDSVEETAAVFPPTYVVVQFSRHIKRAALVWLVDKICGKRLDGGAELLIRRQPHHIGEVCRKRFRR